MPHSGIWLRSSYIGFFRCFKNLPHFCWWNPSTLLGGDVSLSVTPTPSILTIKSHYHPMSGWLLSSTVFGYHLGINRDPLVRSKHSEYPLLVERVARIELASSAWQADALPTELLPLKRQPTTSTLYRWWGMTTSQVVVLTLCRLQQVPPTSVLALDMGLEPTTLSAPLLWWFEHRY